LKKTPCKINMFNKRMELTRAQVSGSLALYVRCCRAAHPKRSQQDISKEYDEPRGSA